MGHGHKKKNDKIASSAGKTGLEHSQRCPSSLLPSVLAQNVYTASVVRNFSPAAIPKDRLSRYYRNAQGLLGSTQGARTQEGTSLFHTLLCRTTAGKKRAFQKLLSSIFKHAQQVRLIEKYSQGAIDATGMEARHTSLHFVHCSRRESFFRRRWPKLTIVCDTRTHLIAGCIVTRGPSLDFPNLPKVMQEANNQISFDQVLADAGYDSEANHCFCREVLGIRSTVIAYNPRRTSKLPQGKYRRQMATNFDKKAYNNRWQVESVFSRNKRLLGPALRARKDSSRQHECFLRILTHNLMIIRRAA